MTQHDEKHLKIDFRFKGPTMKYPETSCLRLNDLLTPLLANTRKEDGFAMAGG